MKKETLKKLFLFGGGLFFFVLSIYLFYQTYQGGLSWAKTNEFALDVQKKMAEATPFANTVPEQQGVP